MPGMRICRKVWYS